MKNLIVCLIMATLLLPVTSNAQEPNKKDKSEKKIEIQTSAQCDECKERIEKNMAFEKGVKYVNLDLETKILTVKYRADKTDETKLRKAVSKIGYDADDVPADPEAYAKLPECCQKGGHDHPHNP
jgi:cation transport ATPase